MYACVCVSGGGSYVFVFLFTNISGCGRCVNLEKSLSNYI